MARRAKKKTLSSRASDVATAAKKKAIAAEKAVAHVLSISTQATKHGAENALGMISAFSRGFLDELKSGSKRRAAASAKKPRTKKGRAKKMGAKDAKVVKRVVKGTLKAATAKLGKKKTTRKKAGARKTRAKKAK